MTERITRSMSGKTPSKPYNPGFIETPGRKKYSRKSVLPSGFSDSGDSTPEPFARNSNIDVKPRNGSAILKDLLENTNGSTNGSTNGHANGHAKQQVKYEKIDLAKLTDPAMAHTDRFEFGGSVGVSAMMIGFPTLMYYMWIGARFYGGKFPTPVGDESFTDFLHHMWFLVQTEAFPHRKAWAIYIGFMIVQMTFYMLLPGVYRKGKPLPHLGGKQLDYYCSAMWSFYTNIVLAFVLHYTGVFRLYILIEEFGPIMSVAIITGFGMSLYFYISALVRGAQIRMTGYPIYDFFMGAELNPRWFGLLDFKMFFEVRIPWFILFFLSLATATQQYEQYGYVSGNVCFILLAHYLYAQACSKAEHMIITTWDMYYEKLGFMLTFWNLAGVPLSYCHSTLYLAYHHPDEYRKPWWAIAVAIGLYLFIYYVWDTCNSQKNQFRYEESGITNERSTFPCFSYGVIKNPKTIPTRAGHSILADGWYGKARKVHYTCDLFFCLSWGWVTGFDSPFPWFYSVFFTGMIIHRAIRDDERCQSKYQEAWTEYKKQVPYWFIPYVF